MLDKAKLVGQNWCPGKNNYKTEGVFMGCS